LKILQTGAEIFSVHRTLGFGHPLYFHNVISIFNPHKFPNRPFGFGRPE